MFLETLTLKRYIVSLPETSIKGHSITVISNVIFQYVFTDFLLVFRCKYMSAFHPFREITISWSKTQIFVIFLSVYFVCIFDYSFHATEEMVAKRTTILAVTSSKDNFTDRSSYNRIMPNQRRRKEFKSDTPAPAGKRRRRRRRDRKALRGKCMGRWCPPPHPTR